MASSLPPPHPITFKSTPPPSRLSWTQAAFQRCNLHQYSSECRSISVRSTTRCQGWFEFNSDLSQESKPQLKTGDFTILSHLKDLGCGELKSKPKAIHFRGCINESYTFDCVGGKFFVKVNRSFGAKDMFASEYRALQELHTSKSIRAPHPLGCGDLPDGGSYIILEHLQFRPFGMLQRKSQETLGKSLARLHQSEAGDLFGFPLNTRLGVLSLENAWTSTWKEFFIEKRLKERLMRVYADLGDQAVELQSKENRLLEKVADVLDAHNCKPSILHGDLWMGNTGLLITGEVAIFDPATFVGDAEFDLAFQGWAPVPGFPGFSEAFYQSYHEMLPQTHGFEDRQKIYQLFHLLNHFLMYGAEYYVHVLHLVDTLM